MNLLLTEQDGVWHYSTIKNFSGFLHAQYNKDNNKYFHCYSCLHGFIREDLLNEHIKYCKQQKAQRVSYPKDKVAEFTNIQKTMKQPFVGYIDFECLLERVSNAHVTIGITDSTNKEVKYQSHTPASYFTKFVSIDSEFNLPERDGFEFPQRNTHVGEDAAEHFLDYVQTVADKIFKKYIAKPKDMIYNNEDKTKFEEATKCHICDKKFNRAIATEKMKHVSYV